MTPTTASIIDHVIVSMKDKIKECGVIASGFSDHFITFCSRGPVKDMPGVENVRKIRSFRDYTPARLCEELTKLDWTEILLSTDVNH